MIVFLDKVVNVVIVSLKSGDNQTMIVAAAAIWSLLHNAIRVSYTMRVCKSISMYTLIIILAEHNSDDVSEWVTVYVSMNIA